MNYKKQLLFNIILGLVIIAFLLIGIFYFAFSFQKNIKNVASVKEEILQKNLNLMSFASIKNIYETKVKKYLTVLESSLFTKNELVKFLNDTQLIADNLKVDSFNINFLDKETLETQINSSLGFLSFNINLVSDLDKFLIFIDNFEKLNFFKNIEFINLEEKENGKYNILIQGKVFYRIN